MEKKDTTGQNTIEKKTKGTDLLEGSLPSNLPVRFSFCVNGQVCFLVALHLSEHLKLMKANRPFLQQIVPSLFSASRSEQHESQKEAK